MKHQKKVIELVVLLIILIDLKTEKYGLIVE